MSVMSSIFHLLALAFKEVGHLVSLADGWAAGNTLSWLYLRYHMVQDVSTG